MTAPLNTLWLHIGLPKTGTSYIQSSLQNNRRIIQEQGLLYPLTGAFGGGHPLFAWPLLSSSRQKKKDVARHKNRLDPELWKKLRSEAEAFDGGAAVLSSEYFAEVESHQTLRLHCDELATRTRVVVYLRRQDELIESGYNQEVKAGLTAHKFIPPAYQPFFDYSAYLQPWALAFGRANICVRIYNSQLTSKGVLEDFADLIGLNSGAFELSQSVRNDRLDPRMVEFQRVSNSLGIFDNQLALHVSENLGSQEAVDFLDPTTRREILEHYTESNCKVAREYLGLEGDPFHPIDENACSGDFLAPGKGLRDEEIVHILQAIWKKVNS